MLQKLSLSILFLLVFFCCNGQDNQASIRRQVDSLDNIQPVALKKVKPLGRNYSIYINNQKQFDGINQIITSAIRAGYKNIRIKIGPGVYHFKEYHILRKDESADDVCIIIEGYKAILSSESNYNSKISSEPWGLLIKAEGLIEVVDTIQKICFIPFRNSYTSEDFERLTKVQITQMYRAVIYDVHHIDKQGIYFVASDLHFCQDFFRKGYNVNYDYLYKEKTPRFRLYDKLKDQGHNASRFLVLVNSNYRSFTISGIRFSGNGKDGALFMTNRMCTEQFHISNCLFENIKSSVGIFGETGNILFEKNTIRNTEGNELLFTRGCDNIRIINNLFENCGNGLSQTFCLNCGESKYYIANNTFRDFGYAAIGVGVSYLQNKDHYSGGIIEYNEFYYTPTYIAHKDKHTLMDSGAIYAWTQNDDVIIRYNYIHDYEGAGDNRGIFCDDGACNIKIYGNIVLNTPDGYSIDSRYVKDQRYGLKNNSNNFIAFNVVDNKVRFMGCETERRHCVKGANFIISEEPITKNKFSCLDLQVEDIKTREYFNYSLFKRLGCKKYIQKLINNH